MKARFGPASLAARAEDHSKSRRMDHVMNVSRVVIPFGRGGGILQNRQLPSFVHVESLQEGGVRALLWSVCQAWSTRSRPWPSRYKACRLTILG